jgi:predicted nucleic acid-binding protein
MISRVVIDSNFYISHARQGRDPFAQLAAAGDEWEIATCGMITFEVLRGVKHPAALERFAEAFSVMVFIPTSNQVWDRAWRLAWEMDRAGLVIPAQDLVIAAHALYAEAAVLTADHHFHQVPGLQVFDRLS